PNGRRAPLGDKWQKIELTDLLRKPSGVFIQHAPVPAGDGAAENRITAKSEIRPVHRILDGGIASIP
ncbi:hypothetical protein, partial [Pseudomonas aeruginosa]|uniref:hypothetical protein n=1 Tax=Pseudomonas aeruginosa TaxID=287 RepID=UPI00235949A0